MTKLDSKVAIDVAARIGDRLRRAAMWSGGECTWTVATSKYLKGRFRVVEESAGGTLYQGTAGIGLFLVELAQATGDARLAATAEGALRLALRSADEMSRTELGFFSGRIGVAYVLCRAATCFSRQQFAGHAMRLLRESLAVAGEDRRLDVIGGAAGSIPPLLAMRRQVGGVADDLALLLGERLLAESERGPRGWSWPSVRTAKRNLVGLAHGTAGVANALLELWAETGDGRFGYASGQAIAYERAAFSPADKNWPDYRNLRLHEVFASGDLQMLRSELAMGDGMWAEPCYMWAWCHGAPGIGLARLRALELVTNDSTIRLEAEAAAASTKSHLLSSTNYSLCHGCMGNAEMLVEASRVLGDEGCLATAYEAAADGVERYERAGRPWPCGTMNHTNDPSLMLGEAGIGYWFLRIADPSTPAVLLPKGCSRGARSAVPDKAFRQLRYAYGAAHFGIVTSLVFHSDAASDELEEFFPSQSDVMRIHNRLGNILAFATGTKHDVLVDATALARALIEVDAEIEDWARLWCAEMLRPVEQEVLWETACFRLRPFARLLETQRDWSRWRSVDDAPPPEEECNYIIYPWRGKVRATHLGNFAAALLRLLSEARTCDEIAHLLAERTDGVCTRAARDQLRELAAQQLRNSYGAGFIECAVARPSQSCENIWDAAEE